MIERDMSNPGCDDALAALQRELDGEGAPSSKVFAHVTRCRVCRERFEAAQMFLAAYPPKPPAGLADKITLAVRADRRQRTYRRYFASAAALAACLVLAVRLSWPAASTEVIAAPTLDDRFADAKSAMLAWTDATAKGISLPEDWGATFAAPDNLSATWEPASASLADAGRGLADGFEPIAASAKRAVTLFRRDLPMND